MNIIHTYIRTIFVIFIIALSMYWLQIVLIPNDHRPPEPLLIPEALGAINPAQIYTPIPYPEIQFFDDSGDPCNACKLYTYVVATSTTTATYSNYTGTPNTNPVVLDSAGRATIFFSSAVNYRMVLKDSTDTTTYFDVNGVRFAAVDQVLGTANQVAVSANTGSVTFSLTGPHNFTTLAQNGVLFGNATGAIGATAASAGSSVLIGAVGNPAFSSTPGVDSLSLSLTAFASLGTANIGTIKFCSNCGVTTGITTCAATGTGALAVYTGTTWSCF